MSVRALNSLLVDVRVSSLAALAPVAAALEEWGSGGWQDLGEVCFLVVWVVVAAIVVAEAVVAYSTGRHRIRASLWVALVALANPLAEPLIKALLGARAARALRLRKEFREEVGRQVFSGRGLRFVVALSILGLFALGWLFSAVESTQRLTLGDGVWFALVTAATVGYGDIVPTTTLGRFIGAVLMVLGLLVVGLLTGAVAERFVRNKRIEDEVVGQLDELAARLERIEAGLAAKTDGS